ncbi:hypothetical protein P3G55_06025 [Leptospira sp. 96542]|nr:hypothetical protein [Leptospira sp. 96542]
MHLFLWNLEKSLYFQGNSLVSSFLSEKLDVGTIKQVDIRRIWQSGFILLLAVFFNLNLVDDRFVSPLEDLDYKYQAYELEETTRCLSIQSQSKKIIKPAVLPKWDSLFPTPVVTIDSLYFQPQYFSELNIFFHFLYLPPPTLA